MQFNQETEFYRLKNFQTDIYNSWFPYVAEDASDVDKEERQYAKEFLMDSVIFPKKNT